DDEAGQGGGDAEEEGEEVSRQGGVRAPGPRQGAGEGGAGAEDGIEGDGGPGVGAGEAPGEPEERRPHRPVHYRWDHRPGAGDRHREQADPGGEPEEPQADRWEAMAAYPGPSSWCGTTSMRAPITAQKSPTLHCRVSTARPPKNSARPRTGEGYRTLPSSPR